jgi:transposase-like protein
MSKFKTEEKIQIVLRYLEGNGSIEKIAEEVRVSKTILSGWVRLYEQHGIEAFIKSYTNYSGEFKLNVLNYMNETGTSSYDTAAIFNISSPGMVRNWRKAFETGGIDALHSKKKGRPSMKKVSKLNKEQQLPVEGSIEALRAENDRLRMENAYLKKLNALVREQEKLQTKSKRK